MQNDRYKRWVDNSASMFPLDIRLISDIQGLGLIDVELIKECSKININSNMEKDKIKKLKHYTLSEWWVIRAYELIRLINELVSLESGLTKRDNIFSDETIRRISELKKRFEEVRVPLVKYKKAGRRNPLFSGISWFKFHPEKGYAFKISSFNNKNKVGKNIVYRLTLSDALLDLFQKMRYELEEINN